MTTEATTDECIELAAALEMRRALNIVAEVAALPVGGQGADMPTPFQAGYQLACEEIAERIRTQVVVLPGGLTLPACGPLPSISQPATDRGAWTCSKCGYCGFWAGGAHC